MGDAYPQLGMAFFQLYVKFGDSILKEGISQLNKNYEQNYL